MIITSSGALTLFTLQLAASAIAAEVYIALNVVNALVAPDGYVRSAVTANGSIPGPLISGSVGDRFIIDVEDNLSDPSMRRSTAIHYHGLHQGYYMDGSAAVTQCPIVPGHGFTYNFSCPQQSGTYWYHAHLSTQYCDGLSGPLVIYDPEDPHKDLYDIDDESTILTLSDWYHEPAASHKSGLPPTPDATLINGLGRWSKFPSSELAVIKAQSGKRHRFRLINMSCYPPFTFSVDSHNLTIIEADGIETEPVTVDSLIIYPGQRYSVVVSMDQPVDNYWIRAVPSVPANSTTEGGINSAILRYDGAPIAEPAEAGEGNKAQDALVLQENDIHPLISPGAPGDPYPGGADVVLDLVPQLSNGSWAVNNASFTAPSVPLILQLLSGTKDAKDLLPAGSVYTLPPNATVEVTLPFIAHHPFHLHGQSFDVVKPSGTSEWNFENPVRRDVLSNWSKNDTVTLRFRTDNPGPWLFHCHLDWHVDQGLGVAFVVDADKIASDRTAPDDWSELCHLYEEFYPDKHLD